jgi:lysozyme
LPDHAGSRVFAGIPAEACGLRHLAHGPVQGHIPLSPGRFSLRPRSPGRAHPYICPAGYWTIGYGRLCKPDHPPITEEEGETFLRQDLRTALNATLRYCPLLAAEPEGRLAAIVDFTFNLGAGRLQTSTLRRRINQRDWAAAATELRRWVYGGGKVLPGLVTRREAEIRLLGLR